MLYLQPILQLNDGAVKDGGRQPWGDADRLGDGLCAGRAHLLTLLFHNVVRVYSPEALGKEALLFVKEELWLHHTSGTVADLRHHLQPLTLRGQ